MRFVFWMTGIMFFFPNISEMLLFQSIWSILVVWSVVVLVQWVLVDLVLRHVDVQLSPDGSKLPVQLSLVIPSRILSSSVRLLWRSAEVVVLLAVRQLRSLLQSSPIRSMLPIPVSPTRWENSVFNVRNTQVSSTHYIYSFYLFNEECYHP